MTAGTCCALGSLEAPGTDTPAEKEVWGLPAQPSSITGSCGTASEHHWELWDSPAASLGVLGQPSNITGSSGTASQQPDRKKYPLPAAMLCVWLVNVCPINTASPHAAGFRDAQHHQHQSGQPGRGPAGSCPAAVLLFSADSAGTGAQRRSPSPAEPWRSAGLPLLPSQPCAEPGAGLMPRGQRSCGGDWEPGQVQPAGTPCFPLGGSARARLRPRPARAAGNTQRGLCLLHLH